MIAQQTEALLKRFKYKQGWTFELRNSGSRASELWASWEAPDATGIRPGLIPIRASAIVSLDHIATEREFWQFLRNAIRKWEFHELDEFFQVDGVAIYDPH